MDIVSALESEASKLQKQLNSINSAIEILGGKNSISRGKRPNKTAHVCKRKSQNSQGAKGTLGEGKSREEECLNNFPVCQGVSVLGLSVPPISRRLRAPNT